MEDKYVSNLTKREKEILVNSGTEEPFSGEYNDFDIEGEYVCKACDSKLFDSHFKFNAKCGWPSFDDVIEDAVIRKRDTTLGRIRTEIICANCMGHLGHVFEGEKYTEKDTRYCVNSLSLKFIEKKK